MVAFDSLLQRISFLEVERIPEGEEDPGTPRPGFTKTHRVRTWEGKALAEVYERRVPARRRSFWKLGSKRWQHQLIVCDTDGRQVASADFPTEFNDPGGTLRTADGEFQGHIRARNTFASRIIEIDDEQDHRVVALRMPFYRHASYSCKQDGREIATIRAVRDTKEVHFDDPTLSNELKSAITLAAIGAEFNWER